MLYFQILRSFVLKGCFKLLLIAKYPVNQWENIIRWLIRLPNIIIKIRLSPEKVNIDGDIVHFKKKISLKCKYLQGVM